MTRLALTKNRLPDLSFGRQPAKSNFYRFGRRTKKWTGSIARGLRGVFRAMLQGVVAAKMRRLRNELQFCRNLHAPVHFDVDAARLPQRPLMLDDKWDFKSPAER